MGFQFKCTQLKDIILDPSYHGLHRGTEGPSAVVGGMQKFVSHKSVARERPTKIFHKNSLQQFPLQECPTTVSHKSVPQDCATVPQEHLLQECRARVSNNGWPFAFE